MTRPLVFIFPHHPLRGRALLHPADSQFSTCARRKPYSNTNSDKCNFIEFLALLFCQAILLFCRKPNHPPLDGRRGFEELSNAACTAILALTEAIILLEVEFTPLTLTLPSFHCAGPSLAGEQDQILPAGCSTERPGGLKTKPSSSSL